MVKHHDQGDASKIAFNLAYCFERIRVRDNEAKEQLGAHILVYKQEGGREREKERERKRKC